MSILINLQACYIYTSSSNYDLINNTDWLIYGHDWFMRFIFFVVVFERWLIIN